METELSFTNQGLIAYLEKGYTISKDGILYNPDGIQLKGSINGGYRRTSFRFRGTFANLFFHRIVAYIKYGNELFKDGIEVRHLNGNPLDNSFDNIAIGTGVDNSGDKCPLVVQAAAEYAASFNVKWNKEEVRQYHENSSGYKQTMNHFGFTSKGSLWHVLNK